MLENSSELIRLNAGPQKGRSISATSGKLLGPLAGDDRLAYKNARMSTDKNQRGPFFVEDSRLPHATLEEARTAAALRQLQGERRSLAILTRGRVVDVKRF